MARRVSARHEILPNVAVSLCDRDIEMYNVPAVRPLMGKRNLHEDAENVYVAPFRIYAFSGKRTELVTITNVKPLKSELGLLHCSKIRITEITNFTRLADPTQAVIIEYCGKIAPHRMTTSAAQVHQLLSENAHFLRYLAELLHVKRTNVLQYRHVRRFFPNVSRSTWQSQLTADQKRPYRSQDAG